MSERLEPPQATVPEKFNLKSDFGCKYVQVCCGVSRELWINKLFLLMLDCLMQTETSGARAYESFLCDSEFCFSLLVT